MKKIIIESKMRSLKFLDDIKKISKDIFFRKNEIINSDNWKTYFISNEYRVKVGGYDLFCNTYPNNKNSGGFMKDDTVWFYIYHWYDVDTITKIIMHEIEHAIDYTEDYYTKNRKQRNLQILAYSSVYNPEKSDDPIEEKLITKVKNILYLYWVNTEKNAYATEILFDYDDMIDKIEYALGDLEWIKSVDAEKYFVFWFGIQSILTNKKNYNPNKEITANRIKNHFISQSYRKIKQYTNILLKKYRYITKHKINGTALNKKNKFYFYDKMQYGPFTRKEMDILKNRGIITNDSLIYCDDMPYWMSSDTFFRKY